MAACAKVSLVSRLCEGKPGVMGDACARTSLGLFEICLGLLLPFHTLAGHSGFAGGCGFFASRQLDLGVFCSACNGTDVALSERHAAAFEKVNPNLC